MEKYREKIKRETGLLLIGALVLIAVQILAFARRITPTAGDSHWSEMWNGFIAGASFGVTALFVVGIVVNLLALRNEKRLKKLYAKENDERTQQIVSKAQAAGMRTALILGIVAVVAAGYFNSTVSLTILACIFAASLITIGFKIFYNLKC